MQYVEGGEDLGLGLGGASPDFILLYKCMQNVDECSFENVQKWQNAIYDFKLEVNKRTQGGPELRKW